MAYNYEYPYVNMIDYNNDWLINKVKELASEWAKVKQDWTDQQEAFNSLKEYINAYFENLNVENEINSKLDSMVTDGTLSEILRTVIGNPYQLIFVSDLSDMLDHTKQYVYTVDGHIYYYNGSVFADSGITYTQAGNVITSGMSDTTSFDDLDDVPSNKYFFFFDSIEGVKNTPNGVSGRASLITYDGTLSNSTPTQILTVVGGDVFIRVKNASIGFLPWINLSTFKNKTDALHSKNKVYNTAGAIDASDLDASTVEINSIITYNGISTSAVKNFPLDDGKAHNFYLITFSAFNNIKAYNVQLCVYVELYKTYIRSGVNDTLWTPWIDLTPWKWTGNSVYLPLKGKKVALLGDSIAKGYIDASGSAIADDPYIAQLSKLLGFTYNNLAVGGAGYVSGDSTVRTQLDGVTDESVIIIQCGVNDYTRQISLDLLFDEIINLSHLIPMSVESVLVITPFNIDYPLRYNTLDKYREVIEGASLTNGWSVISGDSVPLPYLTSKYPLLVPDGVHPSQLGHDTIAKSLYTILK